MEIIYKIFSLSQFYPKFVGANPIAVVSDFPEEELLKLCPELRCRMPFVHFSISEWRDFRRIQAMFNHDRIRKKRDRHEDCYGYQEGYSEKFALFSAEEDTLDEALKHILMERLQKVLSELPDIQRRRVLLYYSGYTYAEIAESENVLPCNVMRSVRIALKNIRKKF